MVYDAQRQMPKRVIILCIIIHSMYKELIIIKYIIKIKERREAPSIIIYY